MDSLDHLGGRHHGIIALRWALAAGSTEANWRRALRVGQLEMVHRGVARVVGSPRTREQQITAAVAAAGPGALASHRSGAFLWGVRRPPNDPVDVIVPERTRRTRLDGVSLHHPRDVADLRAVTRSGIPTTDPLRTVLDLGAVHPAGVQAAVDHVVRTRLASPRAIRRFLDQHARSGRAGVRPLRTALAHWAIYDQGDADSRLETRMAEVRSRYGLPHLTFHAIAAGYEVDFLVTGTQIVIECDGHESHGLDRDQFEFDRLRGAHLSAAGFIVVHVTWRQLEHQPRRTAEDILAVIRRWAPHLAA
ncbi:MAG: DUF559 domain-containing protein [Ilumatobacteraceae bacterium]